MARSKTLDRVPPVRTFRKSTVREYFESIVIISANPA
jgi:hypothetical protein